MKLKLWLNCGAGSVPQALLQEKQHIDQEKIKHCTKNMRDSIASRLLMIKVDVVMTTVGK
jgi:hypothetical protein